MKKIILAVAILVIGLSSCTQTEKEKYRAENQKALIEHAYLSVLRFTEIKKQLVLKGHFDDAMDCDFHISQKDEIAKLSYMQLRQQQVYNKHFLKVFTSKLNIPEKKIKMNEVMAKGNNENQDNY